MHRGSTLYDVAVRLLEAPLSLSYAARTPVDDHLTTQAIHHVHRMHRCHQTFPVPPNQQIA